MGQAMHNATKTHLLELAARLRIPRRSRMTKVALVQAIDKANRAATARSKDTLARKVL